MKLREHPETHGICIHRKRFHLMIGGQIYSFYIEYRRVSFTIERKNIQL